MTGPGSSRGGDAQAERPRRREPETARAAVALPPEGEVLTATLADALRDFEIEVSADIDEVVCRVQGDSVLPVCRHLREDDRLAFDYLRLITVVDYVEQEGELEVVYHLYSLPHHHKMVLKTRIPESRAGVDSVTGVWRGAAWFEREMHDLFGVEFKGHPDPSPLILPDDFEGYPGRKSYPLHDYDEW